MKTLRWLFILYCLISFGTVGTSNAMMGDPDPEPDPPHTLIQKNKTFTFLTETTLVNIIASGMNCENDPTGNYPYDFYVNIHEYDKDSGTISDEVLYTIQGEETGKCWWEIKTTLPIKDLPLWFAIVAYVSPEDDIVNGMVVGIYFTDPKEAQPSWNINSIDGEPAFQIAYNGNVSVFKPLLVNGATPWNGAPIVLGQDTQSRGMVITDKSKENPKNIYFGWNRGETHEYAEIFALQENVAWKNFVINPYGGYLGIGTTSPKHLIDTAGGAYCNGSSWVNASSRELKQDIRPINSVEAKAVLERLSPVEYAYKTDPSEKTLGFIAEDVPAFVATNDRKSINPMDIIAILTKVVQEQQKDIERLKAALKLRD